MPESPNDTTRLQADQLIIEYRSNLASKSGKGLRAFCETRLEGKQTDLLLRLVQEDIRFRQSRGEEVSLEDYIHQFPQLNSQAEVASILDVYIPNSEEASDPQFRETRLSQFAKPTHPNRRAPGGPESPLELNWQDIKPGTKFLDFEIVSFLGSGAYGRVYLAKELSLARLVALKYTSARGAEGRALARLNHPNVVRVFREHSIGKKGLLVLQYVRGGSLTDWISARDATTPQAEELSYRDWAWQAAEPQSDSISRRMMARLTAILNKDLAMQGYPPGLLNNSLRLYSTPMATA